MWEEFSSVCVCVCTQRKEVKSDLWCGSCVYICVIGTHVFICMDPYVHTCSKVYIFCVRAWTCGMWKSFLIATVMLKPVGTLKQLPHVSLSIFLNCSAMFRASPNDFHNRAVTQPFTPCEKIPTHLNPYLHRLNETEKLLYVAFSFTSLIPSLFPLRFSWVCNYLTIQIQALSCGITI